jgi:hypothetical protein
MKRLLTAILVAGILAVPGKASWISDGKYAGEFLSIGIDPRALGMGGAYAALATGASAAYWNPAGLAEIRSQEATFMHAEQFDGIVGYDYLGYGRPGRENTGWGFGIIRLGVDDIPVTTLESSGPISADNRVIVDHMTSDTEMAFFAGYGRAHSSVFSYGAAAKLIGKWVAGSSAYGIGFDAGVRYRPLNRLVFGAMLRDVVTTALIWDTGQKELIAPTMKIGAAYQMDIPALIARLTLAADLDLRFTDRGEADQFQLGAVTADSRLGVEYFINVSGTGVALRGGVEPSREPDEEGFFGNYTFGAGLLFRSFHVDYAFLAHPELGDTHRVSLSVLWGHRD